MRDSSEAFLEKTELTRFDLLHCLTLEWVLVLNVNWLLRIVRVSKVLYQLVVFLDLFLVILDRLKLQINGGSV